MRHVTTTQSLTLPHRQGTATGDGLGRPGVTELRRKAGLLPPTGKYPQVPAPSNTHEQQQ